MEEVEEEGVGGGGGSHVVRVSSFTSSATRPTDCGVQGALL